MFSTIELSNPIEVEATLRTFYVLLQKDTKTNYVNGSTLISIFG